MCAYAAANQRTHTPRKTPQAHTHICTKTHAHISYKHQHCQINGFTKVLHQTCRHCNHSIFPNNPNNVSRYLWINIPRFLCSLWENVIVSNAYPSIYIRSSFFVNRWEKKNTLTHTYTTIRVCTNLLRTRQPKVNWLGQKDQFFQQQRFDNHFRSWIFFSHLTVLFWNCELLSFVNRIEGKKICIRKVLTKIKKKCDKNHRAESEHFTKKYREKKERVTRKKPVLMV